MVRSDSTVEIALQIENISMSQKIYFEWLRNPSRRRLGRNYLAGKDDSPYNSFITQKKA